LYLARDDQIWAAIQGADPAINTLLVVGHNPGLETLSQRFLPELTKLHPGQMVRVRFNIDSWRLASKQVAQDVKLV
jgi:phosphohistidine phosphatase SixA